MTQKNITQFYFNLHSNFWQFQRCLVIDWFIHTFRCPPRYPYFLILSHFQISSNIPTRIFWFYHTFVFNTHNMLSSILAGPFRMSAGLLDRWSLLRSAASQLFGVGLGTRSREAWADYLKYRGAWEACNWSPISRAAPEIRQCWRYTEWYDTWMFQYGRITTEPTIGARLWAWSRDWWDLNTASLWCVKGTDAAGNCNISPPAQGLGDLHVFSRQNASCWSAFAPGWRKLRISYFCNLSPGCWKLCIFNQTTSGCWMNAHICHHSTDHCGKHLHL